MITSATHNRTDPHIYGNGVAALTPIEGAARAGYLDAGGPFSTEYATQIGQWQRNYEAGRQWAIAIRAAGIDAPDWPEGERTPAAILNALAEVRRVTGSGTRPEDYQSRPRDMRGPVRAIVPDIRRGRLVERITR